MTMVLMPMTEASLESIEANPDRLIGRLPPVGEGDTLCLETRWKDRDGRSTIVEASRVHEEPVEPI